MDYNIVEALQAVVREKNVDQSTLMESLIVGLQSAAKKKVGLNADIQQAIVRLCIRFPKKLRVPGDFAAFVT